MTQHFDIPYIKHIRDAINHIESFIKDCSREDFDVDIEKQSVVVRQIEIIGEATKNLSTEFKNKHRETPWKDITGMRDRIIHRYFEVDLDIVWRAIKADLPKLKK